jgi:16S rRNA (uracil1498-N3)-methyltransferase
MGAGCLVPVFTERSQAARVNAERMRANAIEAAEQCGVLSLPEIRQATSLAAAIQGLEPDRLLVFCDEDAPPGGPVDRLALLADKPRAALLIGPEGGFSPAERKLILARQPVLRLSLGPRILRADTAAVAALAILQGTIGDWR